MYAWGGAERHVGQLGTVGLIGKRSWTWELERFGGAVLHGAGAGR